MNFGINKKFVALAVIASTLIPASSFAGPPGVRFGGQNVKAVSGQSHWVLGGAGAAVLGGGGAAGVAFGLNAVNWSAVAAASATGGAVALGTVGALTLGVGLGVAAAAIPATYVAYKLHRKYKNKLMAVSSSNLALINRANNPTQAMNEYLRIRLDLACQELLGMRDVEADLGKTKFQSRQSNIFNKSVLTAYEIGNSTPSQFPSIEGTPHLLVKQLECRKIQSASAGSDHILAQILARDNPNFFAASAAVSQRSFSPKADLLISGMVRSNGSGFSPAAPYPPSYQAGSAKSGGFAPSAPAFNVF